MADTTLSNRDKVLADWNASKVALANLTLQERELRKMVVDIFSDAQAFPEMASGTESIDIGFGHDLKITHKLDYKLDNANDCEELHKVLREIETSMEGGHIIAERIVKWKPELSVSEYKLLSPENKARLDRVLTIKPASKSVEIKKRGK